MTLSPENTETTEYLAESFLVVTDAFNDRFRSVLDKSAS